MKGEVYYRRDPSEGLLKVLAGFPNQELPDPSCGDLVEWGKGTFKVQSVLALRSEGFP